MNLTFTSRFLGFTPYSQAEELQLKTASEVRTTGRGTVLGVEHPAVITLGVRGRRELDVVTSSEEQSEIEIVSCRRGGQATLHSPGQLVIYPLLPVRQWGMGSRELIELLERVTSDLLATEGVVVKKFGDEPGLYSERGKLVFFGLRIDRGVSSHGLAINVANDLQLFRHIRSCGVARQNLDSLLFQGVTKSSETLFASWCTHLAEALRERSQLRPEVDRSSVSL